MMIKTLSLVVSSLLRFANGSRGEGHGGHSVKAVLWLLFKTQRVLSCLADVTWRCFIWSSCFFFPFVLEDQYFSCSCLFGQSLVLSKGSRCWSFAFKYKIKMVLEKCI